MIHHAYNVLLYPYNQKLNCESEISTEVKFP